MSKLQNPTFVQCGETESRCFSSQAWGKLNLQRQYLVADLKFCIDLKWARTIHAHVIECLPQPDMFVLNALINMYRKCSSMYNAQVLFDGVQNPDVVQWNTLLLGYIDNGEAQITLDLYEAMKVHGYLPDSVTYIAALKACTSLAVNGDKRQYLDRGKLIHSEISCHMDSYLQNTLIDMYSNCGNMFIARKVFDAIVKPNVVHWNTLLLGYVINGEAHVALELYSKMKERGCVPDSVTYLAALKACTFQAANGIRKGDFLDRGRQIHLETGCHLNHYVQNTLIDMYSKCGSMSEAQAVFDSIQKPDLISWNALLLGYIDNGEGQVALDMFERMNVSPNYLSYIAALKACAFLAVNGNGHRGGKERFLELGRQLHLKIGCHLNLHLQNTLIDMYSKCGSMVEARRVFDRMEKPDVVSWNSLLLGYVENEEEHLTLELFSRMKKNGCLADSVTYIAALKACTAMCCLEQGRNIHLEIGCNMNPHVQCTLIDFYARCGSMVEAQKIFDSAEHPDVVLWNALMLGFAENGEGCIAVNLFARMIESGDCTPNHLTYVAALKGCGVVGALAVGQKIHLEITEFTSHIVAALVSFYAKCGCITEAREVFEFHKKERNVSVWNSLITGYGQLGDNISVFDLFKAMQDEGLHPDGVTFVCLLLSCSHSGLVTKASEYFDAMPGQYGVPRTIKHYNCMVDALGRGNQLDKAIAMIRGMPCSPDVVTWTTLLSACRKWKNAEIGVEALQALVKMSKKNDASTYILTANMYGGSSM